VVSEHSSERFAGQKHLKQRDAVTLLFLSAFAFAALRAIDKSGIRQKSDAIANCSKMSFALRFISP